MDRDQLLALLTALGNDDVAVKADGTVRDLDAETQQRDAYYASAGTLCYEPLPA